MDRLCNLVKAGDYTGARTLLSGTDLDINDQDSDGRTVMGLLHVNIAISTMKYMLSAYKTYDTLQYVTADEIIKAYKPMFEFVVYCIKIKQAYGYEIDDWVICMINETIDMAFDVVRYEHGQEYLDTLGKELEVIDIIEIDALINRAMESVAVPIDSMGIVQSTNTGKCSSCKCIIC